MLVFSLFNKCRTKLADFGIRAKFIYTFLRLKRHPAKLYEICGHDLQRKAKQKHTGGLAATFRRIGSYVRADLQSARIEYRDFQSRNKEIIALKMLILYTVGLQIRQNKGMHYGRKAEMSCPKWASSRTMELLRLANCGEAGSRMVSMPVSWRLTSAICIS